MLVFIDESGDTGRKVGQGSSEYFVIALVTFEENEEAIACDKRIELLKRELGKKAGTEFKFSKMSKEHRLAFIQAVKPYSFFYFGIIINKNPEKLYGDGFAIKESFYKYTCSLVFENAKPYLRDATVVIDGSGSRVFKRQLQAYLKKKTGTGIIKKIKLQSSHSNNLIQLADFVAGALKKSLSSNTDNTIYRHRLSLKELNVQIWPR